MNDRQTIELTAGTGSQSTMQTVALQTQAVKDPDYWTIEGMRSQKFSVGIFIFMVIGILVFLGIIAKFVHSASKTQRLKSGEKVLIAWIILGTVVAAAFGALQLLQGRLF